MNHDDNDPELFRAAVGKVRRLRSRRDPGRQTPPGPRPQMREADEHDALDALARPDRLERELETGEELQWLRPGLQQRLLKRLRRGHWRIQDELDLHRMNVEAAGRSIRIFLAEAGASQRRCVKIIHGKGLRSGPGGPRLKALTARVLARHPEVLAFTSAPRPDGGTGAVYVLLGQRR